MRVIHRGQAGTDVQELADPRLARQKPDGAGEEVPRGPGRVDDLRKELPVLVTGGPVNGVVVLAAQPLVPDPGGVRHGDVDLGKGRPGNGRVVGHGVWGSAMFSPH